MEISSTIKSIGVAFAVGAFMFACTQETQNETNAELNEAQTEMGAATDEAQAEMNEAGDELNEAGDEMAIWTDENETRAETATEEEWEQMKADYKKREAEVEAKSADWDEDQRSRWQKVKDRYKKTEDKVQARFRD